MIKYIQIIITASLLAGLYTPVNAKTKDDFFSGGMAFHIGYSSIENSEDKYSGPAFGIGGLLHFYVLDFLRIGSGGASSWMNYETNGPDGSYMKLGYGGITIEFSKPIQKWRLSTGVLLGGGTYKNLHLISKDDDEIIRSKYTDKGTFIFSPLISIERNINESIKTFATLDFIVGPNISNLKHFGGPKLLLGVLFRK